mmetsp:Transcript_140823/g.248654  ORF Transcript_140823/g.248654 Transcript_140823/m.248654 type:complete len:91 (+) Transcript_140823:161-433(+)
MKKIASRPHSPSDLNMQKNGTTRRITRGAILRSMATGGCTSTPLRQKNAEANAAAASMCKNSVNDLQQVQQADSAPAGSGKKADKRKFTF